MDLAWNIPNLILIIVPEGKKVVRKTVENPNSTNEAFAFCRGPNARTNAWEDGWLRLLPANLTAEQLDQLQIVRNAKHVCLLVGTTENKLRIPCIIYIGYL